MQWYYYMLLNCEKPKSRISETKIFVIRSQKKQHFEKENYFFPFVYISNVSYCTVCFLRCQSKDGDFSLCDGGFQRWRNDVVSVRTTEAWQMCKVSYCILKQPNTGAPDTMFHVAIRQHGRDVLRLLRSAEKTVRNDRNPMGKPQTV